MIRRQGHIRNHKRVHRIYCLLKLNFRRKGKQRLPVRNPAPLATPEALNQSRSIDFMHDALTCGRRFRPFNVVDDFNREALAIESSCLMISAPLDLDDKYADFKILNRDLIKPAIAELNEKSGR